MSRAKTWTPPKTVLPCMAGWFHENIVKPTAEKAKRREKSRAAWSRLMANDNPVTPVAELSALDKEMLAAIWRSGGHYHHASFEYRFIDATNRINGLKGFTAKQLAYGWLLCERLARKGPVPYGARNENPALRAVRRRRQAWLKAHRDGIDWRPSETVPEDYYCV